MTRPMASRASPFDARPRLAANCTALTPWCAGCRSMRQQDHLGLPRRCCISANASTRTAATPGGRIWRRWKPAAAPALAGQTTLALRGGAPGLKGAMRLDLSVVKRGASCGAGLLRSPEPRGLADQDQLGQLTPMAWSTEPFLAQAREHRGWSSPARQAHLGAEMDKRR